MDGLGPHRVRGDSGSRPNSPASVEGGQASHAPSIREQGQAIEGDMDILLQIAQALQRAAQPAAVVPQWSAIERMEKYQPIDFLRNKDDEPSTQVRAFPQNQNHKKMKLGFVFIP